MLTRRTLLALSLTALGVVPARAEHPSVGFTRQVGKELLAAHRKGTTPAFLRVIQRYADVPEISQFSLGKYQTSLKSGQRPQYQRAVATYMARYFALMSREYTIAKYEVGEATVDANKNVIVKSKVFLVTGQSYSVDWQLVWRGGAYKVRDVKVILWLTPFQKREFVAFLDKYNGDINRLIKALYG
jgi:phospholipid transport system substrate-binding protein